jgi:hypothetical protein
MSPWKHAMMCRNCEYSAQLPLIFHVWKTIRAQKDIILMIEIIMSAIKSEMFWVLHIVLTIEGSPLNASKQKENTPFLYYQRLSSSLDTSPSIQ